MDQPDHTIRADTLWLLIGPGLVLLPSHWLAPAECLTPNNQISLTWELSLLSAQCTMYLHTPPSFLSVPFVIFRMVEEVHLYTKSFTTLPY